MKRDAIEEKVAALDALHHTPFSALEPVRKALKDRNNLVAAKAGA